MHATQISTNTRKYVIFGKSFYIQTPELVNPKLADIRGLLRRNLFINSLKIFLFLFILKLLRGHHFGKLFFFY